MPIFGGEGGGMAQPCDFIGPHRSLSSPGQVPSLVPHLAVPTAPAVARRGVGSTRRYTYAGGDHVFVLKNRAENLLYCRCLVSKDAVQSVNGRRYGQMRSFSNKQWKGCSRAAEWPSPSAGFCVKLGCLEPGARSRREAPRKRYMIRS